ELENGVETNMWESFETIPEEPSSDGRLAWNISHLLEGLVNASPPSITASSMEEVGIVGRIRVFFQELTDGVQTDLRSNYFSYIYRAGFNEEIGQDLDNRLNSGDFLGVNVPSKLMTIYQPDWVHFVPNTTGSYKLRKAVTLFNNQVLPPSTMFERSMIANRCYAAPCGYNELFLYIHPEGVRSWQVWMEDASGNAVSEVRSFHIDPYLNHERTRYLMFEQSRGGFTTLAVNGIASESITVSSKEVRRMRPITQEDRSPDIYQRNSRYQLSYTHASGYYPSGHAPLLKELLLSEQVYRLGGFEASPFAIDSLTPIRIDRTTSVIKQDEEFFDFLDIKYQDAKIHRAI
ncbi:MAG: hypothetical protein AAFQ92_22315, partial [Bacteroidota bacterium]